MIKLVAVCETKVYNGENNLDIVKHSLDTQISFDHKDNNIVNQVYNKLKQMFNYEISPEPSFISGDDTFFTFKVIPSNSKQNK